MIPRAKPAIWVRAPPENRFRKLRTPPWLAWCWSFCTWLKSIPGTVTFDPSLYRAMMNNVNRILFRRSGIRNMFRKLESTGRAPALAVCQGIAPSWRTAVAERWWKDLKATACRRNRLLGGLGEGVGLHLQGSGQLAPAQDLHQPLLGHQALGAQRVRGHLVAIEGLEGVEVDHRVLDAEGILETLELGHAAGQRHLAALEPDGHCAAGGLALHAPTRGLAALAGDAAADAATGLGGPLRRLQIVNFHLPTSSTSTRCGTRAIMPR